MSPHRPCRQEAQPCVMDHPGGTKGWLLSQDVKGQGATKVSQGGKGSFSIQNRGFTTAVQDGEGQGGAKVQGLGWFSAGSRMNTRPQYLLGALSTPASRTWTPDGSSGGRFGHECRRRRTQ